MQVSYLAHSSYCIDLGTQLGHFVISLSSVHISDTSAFASMTGKQGLFIILQYTELHVVEIWEMYVNIYIACSAYIAALQQSPHHIINTAKTPDYISFV